MAVVVHVSDLHLSDDVQVAARFDAVVRHVRTMAVAPDVVVVTGDVLDGPGGGDYAEVGEALGRLGAPVVACPGNHDDRLPFRRLLGEDPSAAPVNSRLDLPGLTILACDSLVPGEQWGRLEPTTLRWLERELATAGPAVVAVHHVPVPLGIPLVDEIGLREPEALERILRAAPHVLGVLCGHAHTAAATTFAGLPLVVCPAVSSTILLDRESGSTPIFDRETPPAFALHVVEDGRLTSHLRVVGPTLPGRAG